jgi:hypothetical protein
VTRAAGHRRDAIHAPRLFRVARRAIGRMSPNSPLRRALVPRSVSVAQAAYNRRDWSAAVLGYDPEAQVIPPRPWTEMGDFDPVYCGREGLVRYYRQWIESWPNIRVEPHEIIDLGERLFLGGGEPGSGGPVAGGTRVAIASPGCPGEEGCFWRFVRPPQ